MTFTILPLTADDAEDVQALLARSPGYTLRTRGRSVAGDDGHGVLIDRPPGTAASAKTVFGLRDDSGALRGLCDVIHGWPSPETAHIGLLLVDDAAQGSGLGRLLHDSVIAQLRARGDIAQLRAGIVGTNADAAQGFWERLGYRPTGEEHSVSAGTIRSTTAILTRPLDPPAAPPASGTNL
ncbi:GNAT family N-acetyltransferase [Brachybacterium sp. GCM10030268]|uniref:GNAT family N-acetyltransferase n=1 Tax=Brachybacterium sp. GCM10030268 TaxID=3273382 RepID=UPI00361C21F5